MDATGSGEAQSHAGTDIVDDQAWGEIEPSSDGASANGDENAGGGHQGLGRNGELRVGTAPRLSEFSTVGEEAADGWNHLCPIEIG